MLLSKFFGQENIIRPFLRFLQVYNDVDSIATVFFSRGKQTIHMDFSHA